MRALPPGEQALIQAAIELRIEANNPKAAKQESTATSGDLKLATEASPKVKSVKKRPPRKQQKEGTDGRT